jgi:transposase, IS5 family
MDADRRLAAISAKGDPLEMIACVVPFESYRAEIEAVVLTPASGKKSRAGRKPINVMVMFRILVLIAPPGGRERHRPAVDALAALGDG